MWTRTTSGFTDSPEITGRPGCPYLAKPYSPATLGRAVRAALDGSGDVETVEVVRTGHDQPA